MENKQAKATTGSTVKNSNPNAGKSRTLVERLKQKHTASKNSDNAIVHQLLGELQTLAKKEKLTEKDFERYVELVPLLSSSSTEELTERDNLYQSVQDHFGKINNRSTWLFRKTLIKLMRCGLLNIDVHNQFHKSVDTETIIDGLDLLDFLEEIK